MERLAIFVSGNGTNMENLILEIQEGRIPAEATLVVCDNPRARAIERALKLGVELSLIDRKKFASREEFERQIISCLKNKKIGWIVLAGFMRILSEQFVEAYQGRIVNIHPSLLPAFPGTHAIRDAFEARVKETGVSVHFVDRGVDTGPVILQRPISIEPSDTLEALEKKIHQLEYEVYPEALRLVLSKKGKC